MCRSVPQMPVTSTRMSASLMPGWGMGTSSSHSPRSGRLFTRACIGFLLVQISDRSRPARISVVPYEGSLDTVLAYPVNRESLTVDDHMNTCPEDSRGKQALRQILQPIGPIKTERHHRTGQDNRNAQPGQRAPEIETRLDQCIRTVGDDNGRVGGKQRGYGPQDGAPVRRGHLQTVLIEQRNHAYIGVGKTKQLQVALDLALEIGDRSRLFRIRFFNCSAGRNDIDDFHRRRSNFAMSFYYVPCARIIWI